MDFMETDRGNPHICRHQLSKFVLDPTFGAAKRALITSSMVDLCIATV